jgi:hypothetical protein
MSWLGEHIYWLPYVAFLISAVCKGAFGNPIVRRRLLSVPEKIVVVGLFVATHQYISAKLQDPERWVMTWLMVLTAVQMGERIGARQTKDATIKAQ